MFVFRRSGGSVFSFEPLLSRTFIRNKRFIFRIREKLNAGRKQINRSVDRTQNCDNNDDRDDSDRGRDEHDNEFNGNFIDFIRSKFTFFILFRRFDYISFFSRYFVRDGVDFIEIVARRRIKKNKVFANRFRADNNEILFIFVNYRFVAEKANFYDYAVNIFAGDETRDKHRLVQVKKITTTNKTRARVNKNNKK